MSALVAGALVACSASSSCLTAFVTAAGKADDGWSCSMAVGDEIEEELDRFFRATLESGSTETDGGGISSASGKIDKLLKAAD